MPRKKRSSLPASLPPLTPEDRTRRRHFLRALSRTNNATIATEAAGGGRPWFYRHQSLDPGFARRWSRAKRIAALRLAGAKGPKRNLGGIDAHMEVLATAETTVHVHKDGTAKLVLKRDHELGEEDIANFLIIYGQCGNITRAAHSVGFHPDCFHKLRRKSPDFHRQMQDSGHLTLDDLRVQVAATVANAMDGGATDAPEAEGLLKIDITLKEALDAIDRLSAVERRERELEVKTKAAEAALAKAQAMGAAHAQHQPLPTDEETDAVLAEVIAKFDAAAKQRRHEARLRAKERDEANRATAQAKKVAKRRAAKKRK